MEIIRIAKECSELSVEESCRILELNPRAYYRWVNGETRARHHGGGGGHNKLTPEEEKIVVDFARARPHLHPRRIAYELERQGWVYVGKSKVAELMKAHGLNHAFDPGKRRIEIPAGDMMKWEPWRPNYVWGLDWTWVNVGESFMLLLIVVDWYSRKIVGWSLHWTITRFEVVALVTDAVATEEIDLLPASTLKPMVVADHGSANTASYTAENLKILGLDLWLSGIGRPTGNARTERTIGTIRREELALQGAYRDELEARRRIGATIPDYNKFRPNAGNGGFVPNAVHAFGRAKLTEERNRQRRLTENQRREYWIKQQGHAQGVVS